MAEKKRVEWIDVAKGIGMLLVIVGHTMTSPVRYASNINYLIYSAVYFFHMPLMFYLSGRTFGMLKERNVQYSLKEWTHKKWNTLMVPYLVYGTLVYLIFSMANAIPKLGKILSNEGYGKQSLLHWIKGMVTVYGDDLYSFHLWYIYGLFLMSIVSFLVMKYCKKHMWILFIVSLLLIGSRSVYYNISNWGIANLFFKNYFWFVLGTYVDLSKFAKKMWGKIYAILAVVYMWIFIVDFHSYRIEVPSLLLEMIKWIADVGLLIGCIYIAILLKGTLKRFFTYTGQNSYGIYLFHQPFFASGCGTILFKVVGLPVGVAIVITFALCYIVPLFIIKLLNTKYLSFLKPYFLGTPRKKRV